MRQPRRPRQPRKKGRHPRRVPLAGKSPKPLWNTYDEYLLTAHWRLTRSRALERGAGLCARCVTARAVEVHHLTYARLGREKPEDLMALCAACHRAVHSASDHSSPGTISGAAHRERALASD